MTKQLESFPNVRLIHKRPPRTETFRWTWNYRPNTTPPCSLERLQCAFISCSPKTESIRLLATFAIFFEPVVAHGPTAMMRPSTPEAIANSNWAFELTAAAAESNSPSPRRRFSLKKSQPQTSPTPSSIATDSSQRDESNLPCALPSSPVDSADGEFDEDGPLFRATLLTLEKRSVSLRRSLKTMLKAAESVSIITANLEEAETRVDAAISELAETNPSTVQALIEAYWGEARLKKALRRREERGMFQRDVIAPLTGIVADLKAVETRKKVWEAESKEYYDHLSKYLAGPSSTAASDAIAKADDKHVARKERFSRARREYHSALTELSLFREADVLSLLARYARAEHDLFVAAAADLASTGNLSALDRRVEEQAKYVDARREELQIRRRADGQSTDESVSGRHSFDTTTSPNPDGFRGRLKSSLHQLAKTSLDLAQPSSSSKINPKAPSPATANRFRGIRDLELPRTTPVNPTRKKEGFLWATTRPLTTHQGSGETAGARTWHKFWVRTFLTHDL
jgi:Arf-GAP/SH3 domain/ANK repeat/PH domain-containing protein